MAKNIAIPKLGMTMKEAKVVAWKLSEGDWVEKGQVVLVIETAKVTYEVEAMDSGYLHIMVSPETVLPVGAAAGLLAETQEELEEVQAQEPAVAAVAASSAVVEPAVAPPAQAAAGPARPARVKISPAAKKMAEEHNLDYTKIAGSGPGGRIVKEDVQKALAAREAAPTPAEAPVAEAPPGEVIDGKRVRTTMPLKGMRLVIAEHMVRSLQVAAQLTTMTEFDMTELIKVRKRLLERESSIGVRVSYTDLLVYILARTLKDMPMMNASLIDDQIVLWEDINIGVAVALQLSEYESGLIVPVVRNADQKSLAEINRAVASVVEKARSGTIMPDDVTGSTFTLTNTGTFGGGWAWGTPIINQPESAILQTGAIAERPAVVDGHVVVRSMMPVSLTFDHRVLDGAPVAAFLARLGELVQSPELLII